MRKRRNLAAMLGGHVLPHRRGHRMHTGHPRRARTAPRRRGVKGALSALLGWRHARRSGGRRRHWL